MIEPYKGKVYDPCCGSGGMFVQSESFVLAHGGRLRDLSIYGQESNLTTWRLAKMNLAVRGIAGDIRWNSEGSFRNDAHSDLRADFVLANPPFNDSDWGGEHLRNDPRWTYGIPPMTNANFAWVQHFIHHLSPSGVAGFVLANGALSLHQHPESAIRRAMIESDLVDCVVYLPTNLFYNTQISASLWFVTRNKAAQGQRNRRRSTLFIYAADLGVMTDRIHKELTDSEIARITSTYRAWKTDRGNYKDVSGFCKSASIDEIRRHRTALVPGRYVGFDKTSRFIPSPDDLKSELQELRRRADSFGASSERAFSVLQELLNNG
jgi:type I restriction enzyme M protein